jgi:MerR family transcriptional regulator, thiopeptide resistance regulator
MTKEKWVPIMRASGFTDEDMHHWRRKFEKAAPEDHREFLAYLKISGEEIEKIREWSRT